MKRKRMFETMVSVGMACVMTAFSGAAFAEETESAEEIEFAGTITLGVLGPMTDSLAVYGTHISCGVELAVAQINENGGVVIDGEAYELATETKDDQGDSTECLNSFNALIADGIQVVIGSATSGCTSAITSVANSEGIVLITPSGTADSLTTTMDYVFRSCFNDSFQGTLAAQYAADQGYKKVGVVYCSGDTYSAGLRDSFVAACEELGIEVAAEESVASMSNEVDYTNQFTKMVAAEAELVFTPFYYDVMGPYVVTQARSVGFTGDILGGDGVDNTEDYVSDGADLTAFNDVYFVNHYAAELSESEISTDFVEAYEEMYEEEPNNFDAMAYDAVLILAQAMETADSFEAAAVQEALADRTAVYEVVGGTYSFDETGTPVKDGVLVGYSYEEGDEGLTKTAYKVLSVEKDDKEE